MITPVAPCEYAFVFQPDTKFNPEGTYRINLVFDPKDQSHAAFLKEIRVKWEVTGGKNEPWKEHEIAGEKTGMYSVKFKSKYPIKVFDSSNQLVKRETNIIGNDSKVRVAFNEKAYTENGGGLSLYLQSIQIIDLIEYEPEAAFEVVEGGYKQADGFEKLFGQVEKVDESKAKKEGQKAKDDQPPADDLPF